MGRDGNLADARGEVPVDGKSASGHTPPIGWAPRILQPARSPPPMFDSTRLQKQDTDVMRQAPWILILAATAIASAAAISQARAGADPAEADVVAQARKLIADKDLRGAAEALEDALATVPADQRAAVVDLLRETYAKLVEDAKAAGNDREAAELAEDLAILEASPRPAAAAAAPKADPKTEEPKADEPAVVVPRGSQPSDPEPEPTEPPAALELPALSGPADKAAEPSAEAPPAESSVEEIPALSTTAPPPKRTTAPAEALPPAQADASAPVVKVPAPNPAAAELAEADAHFTRKNYGEAGKLYASLAARNSLPAERRKVWAYCRWAAVVDRINAPPRSAEEWDAIEREIDNIQTLVPGNWYGEYLKDRVIDSRKGERHAGRGAGRGLTIRGNTPEEPGQAPTFRPAPGRPLVDDQIQRAGGEAHLDLPAPGAVPPPEPPPAPAQSPASAPSPAASAAPIDWQVLETTNFRVFHVDAALAEKAAEAAEATRISQGAQWGSRAVRGAWTPRCDLYLYPTPADFARMTGQPETSPGFSTMGISGDRVTTRRVNLRADHPQLLTAILPHEVAHVVLADVFTDHQIPRWADEGMAVLAEPPAEQVGRAAELNAPLAQNQVFQLDQLMNIDFPGDEKWGLYYAQSVSLTQFFVRRGTPDQFIAFLKSAQRRGPETALREIYQIEGFADLETQWRAFAHRQASQIASAEDGTAR